MGLERRLSREWDRADEVVLKRALTHAGLIERCVERVDDARAAGTSRLLDYRIRIRAGGTTTTLEGGRDDPTRYGGPQARPAGSVEATEAVITVVDAEGTERTSVIATDVALTTGATRWPEESTVVLARSGRRPTTVELEALLDEALWTPELRRHRRGARGAGTVRGPRARGGDQPAAAARRGRRRTGAPAVRPADRAALGRGRAAADRDQGNRRRQAGPDPGRTDRVSGEHQLPQRQQAVQNQRSNAMGEIRTSVRLENTGDREYVYRGDRAEADVRRTTVEGIVDTGAVNLVIPEEIARELGLRHHRTRTVVYADERREERPVTVVTITIGNLATDTEAIIGTAGSEVLIGQSCSRRST